MTMDLFTNGTTHIHTDAVKRTQKTRKPTYRLTLTMGNRLKSWILVEHEDWLTTDKTAVYLGPTHKMVAEAMSAKFGEAFTNHHVNAVMKVIADEMGKKYHQRPHSPNGSKKQKEAGPRVTIGALEAFKDALVSLGNRVSEVERSIRNINVNWPPK